MGDPIGNAARKVLLNIYLVSGYAAAFSSPLVKFGYWRWIVSGSMGMGKFQ